jgi:hypothetical protein
LHSTVHEGGIPLGQSNDARFAGNTIRDLQRAQGRQPAGVSGTTMQYRLIVQEIAPVELEFAVPGEKENRNTPPVEGTTNERH